MPSPKLVYSRDYDIDIGQHVFPTEKYRLIRRKLIAEKHLKESDFVIPAAASDEDVLLVHEGGYLDKLKNGALSPAEILALEVSYSKELVKASYVCVGGTILACQSALKHGIGMHIGGGFHHAFPDHGEGFCVFNDIAVGIKKMQKDREIKKALVVDCDLHQGNGTAFIFSQDKSVFTFSIHQENNYPFHKPPSDLDIGLRDRVRDDEYIGNLKEHVPAIISDFGPDLIIYVAGADPYKDDRIGALALSMDGLKRRDKFIFDTAKNYGIPAACVLAGGYAEDHNDTVQIHFNTIVTALEK